MHLETKEQAIKILESYKVDTTLPKKGEQKIICFPPSFDFQTVIVKLCHLKSTYGKPLYSFEFKK